MFTKFATLAIAIALTKNTLPAAPTLAAESDSSATRAAVPTLREVLGAARGVAPTMCTLAGDGVFSWGGRWHAPAEATRSDVRGALKEHIDGRRRSRRVLSADDAAALMQGIASPDGCERYMAATIMGRIGDTSVVSSLTRRLSGGSAEEREGAS